MTFDAKKTFTEFTPLAAQEFRATVEQPSFQIGIAMAMAAMATRGATTDEMRGADIFVQIIGNIGEKSKPIVKFPSKTLKTYEEGYEPGNNKDQK